MSTSARHLGSASEGEAKGDRLAFLTEAVARLEARVAALEGNALVQPSVHVEAAHPVAGQESALPAAVLPGSVGLIGLVGRTCLILGGATFIRALVDAGTIHRGWGVALGLAYAITWALLADRAKQSLDASFHALASVLIAYPLLVESTARFGILTPGLAALLLLVVAVIHALVAWRRDLQPIAWTATLAAIGSAFAMMSACRAIEPFLTVLMILGLGTLWGTYGRKWHGLRWPTALATNLGVLILTSLAAWPGGIPEVYRGITPTLAVLFALALAMSYVGSFAIRMLQRRRVVNTFEIAQTALVLLVGVGGALRVTLATGSGAGLIGGGISLAGLGCYAAARPFTADQEETRSNFHFFTFLALSFMLLGGLIVLPAPFFALLSGTLGLALMLAGLRLNRAVLVLQSGLYLVAAALASGLAAWSSRAFLAPAGPAVPLPTGGLLSLAFVITTLALFLRRRPSDALTTRIRPVLLILGAIAAAGLGASLIRLTCGAISAGPTDAGLLAAVRTGVLSLLAILLAWSGRRLPLLELRWLVYPLLLVTGLKFLFEDLAMGRPLTLFLGFMCYGATLMLAPRLLKNPIPSDRKGEAMPSTPEVDS